MVPCSRQDAEPRRGRPKTPANPAASTGQHTTTNEDVLADLVDKVDSKSDLKAEMTLRELKFLEIYLTGEHNIDKAMMLAGYEGYHIKSLYRLGRKIVEKYETQAQDHRKIFRAMGAGEVAVVEGLLNLAKNAKSEMVKLNAWSMIAKCLGLAKEQIEGAAGITIVFEGSDQPRHADRIVAVDEAQEQGQRVPRHEDRHIPGRTLQITR